MAFGIRGHLTKDGKAEAAADRLPLYGLVLGIGILLGGGLGLILARARLPTSATPPLATRVGQPESRISIERQIAARRLETFSEDLFDPFSTPDVVVEGFVESLKLSPPWSAVDSILFDSATTRVRLAHVWPVGRREVCIDAAETRFACGLMGRAALQNFLVGKSVVCTQSFFRAKWERDILVADCRADGIDLAEHLVRSGFAFPDHAAGEPLLAALADARAARRGVWAGPFEYPFRDRTREDAESVSFVANGSEKVSEGSADQAETTAPTRPGPPAESVIATTKKNDRPRPPTRAASVRQTERIAPPPLEKLAPHASEPPEGGVVAGPIQPPPPGLAEKLRH